MDSVKGMVVVEVVEVVEVMEVEVVEGVTEVAWEDFFPSPSTVAAASL